METIVLWTIFIFLIFSFFLKSFTNFSFLKTFPEFGKKGYLWQQICLCFWHIVGDEFSKKTFNVHKVGHKKGSFWFATTSMCYHFVYWVTITGVLACLFERFTCLLVFCLFVCLFACCLLVCLLACLFVCLTSHSIQRYNLVLMGQDSNKMFKPGYQRPIKACWPSGLWKLIREGDRFEVKRLGKDDHGHSQKIKLNSFTIIKPMFAWAFYRLSYLLIVETWTFYQLANPQNCCIDKNDITNSWISSLKWQKNHAYFNQL